MRLKYHIYTESELVQFLIVMLHFQSAGVRLETISSNPIGISQYINFY